MKLTKVATFFNRTPFVSAYDPLIEFKGRLMPFDDATRDSLSTERRLMSVAPGTEIPPRRAVLCGGQAWLVGDKAVDMHDADELRNKYILHHATGIADVMTFEQALTTVTGQQMWSARLWVKANKEVDESSAEFEGYTMYFSKAEDIRDPAWVSGKFTDGREINMLVLFEGLWHLVRTSYESAGGFRVAIVDELPGPVLQQAEFTVKTYDALKDKDTLTTVTVAGVNLRWQSYFTYLTRYSDKYENGDSQLIVLKSAVTTKAGDLVKVLGKPFKVVSVADEDPCWSIHLRHA